MAGLCYPRDLDVDTLPVLAHRPAPHTAIRGLRCAELARLRLAHDCLDTPDSVLFPFLHGIESGNDSQRAFFQKRAAVPNFRGLVWVLATDDDHLRAVAPNDDRQSPDSEDDELFDDDEDDEVLDDAPPVPPVATADASDGPLYANDLPKGYQHLHRGSVSSSSSDESATSNSLDSWTSQTTDTSLGDSLIDQPLSSSSCLPFADAPASMLTSSFLPSELLSLSSSGPVFTPPRVPDGVSLRNFGIQMPIYATISDIVVYSPNGASRSALAVAERFKTAVEAKHTERAQTHAPSDAPLLHYNVFVVTEPFTVFEEGPARSPLVAVTSDGARTASYPDLAAREKDEMHSLTKASEIIPGIFLGNSVDVPVWHAGDNEDPCHGDGNNTAEYDVCVECQDGAPFPVAPHLRQAEDHLAALDSLWSTGVMPGAAHTAVRPATRSEPRPAPNANAVLHLSCPSSPLSTQANIGALLALVEFLVRLSRDGGLHSHTTSARRPMRVLVHSADGYTDSSVLALCLLMFARRSSLPEAYLELQVNRQRSFFVYPQDVPLLRRVETKMAALYPTSPGVPATIAVKRERETSRSREGRDTGRWTWGFGRSNSISISSTTSGSSTPDSALSPPSTPMPLFPPLSSSAPSTPTPLSGSPSPSPSPRRSRASTSAGASGAPLVTNHHSWFNDPRFDGSFPSRVLPFLYLGNLNHAANVYMLHALGITHVVSVGECALVPPAGGSAAAAAAATSGSGSPRCGASHPQGSLWIEEREGRIKVLDIKGVCDDGIDSLRSQFAPICDWIDRARLEGGKVLIHCRVGVSRSATVTIAYVMKHLDLPLVDAYLIVRSRRLSVLIQPNMRLLYNLCGWEAELAHGRVVASFAASPEPQSPVSPSASSTCSLQSAFCDTPASPTVSDCGSCVASGDATLVLSTSTATVHVAPVTTASHAPADLDARLADPAYAAKLQVEMSRKLTWPFLAREVHLLNEKYLS